jgi:thioredoxin 1
MAKPFAVSDAEFDEKVLKADKPVLVDFWADWCVPCKMISPIVDELAEELDGKMTFAKVDVDSSPITAVKYGIRSIPTLLLFSGGEVVDQIIGNVAKANIESMLSKAL